MSSLVNSPGFLGNRKILLTLVAVLSIGAFVWHRYYTLTPDRVEKWESEVERIEEKSI